MPTQLMVCELEPTCDFPASPTKGEDQEEHGDAAPDTETNVSALSPRECLGRPASEEKVPLAHSTHAEKW